MTIHDILVNCSSVQSDTLIIILDDNEEAKWVGIFMDIPKEYEELKLLVKNSNENFITGFYKNKNSSNV